MRHLRIVPLALAWLCLIADCQAQKGSWQAVESLAPGTQISIQPVHGRRFHCRFESANETQIACEETDKRPPCLACVLYPGVKHPGSQQSGPLDRAEVRDVHMEHRAANAALGLAIGAGLGIALGAQGKNTNIDRHIGEAVLGGLFGTIGGLLGKRIPLVHGTAVYEK